jgi:glycosyltransferase involved in cell wall biosynthesis
MTLNTQHAVPSVAEKPSICIIAHNAYGAMAGGKRGHVGGAEHQTSLTARWLAANGYPTTLLTWDEGQPKESVIDGVRIISICRNEEGLPGLRFFHPRLTGLYKAMRRANADIYYHNSAEYVTGLAADWCKANGRAFVYSIASDVACDPKLPVMDKAYERFLYRRGVVGAHKILVQTQRQKTTLENGFRRGAVQLPMPCPGPSEKEFRDVPPPDPNRVVWVGRAAPMKRLEWLLQIAEQLPQLSFELGVANADNEYGRGLRERASKLPNVIWRGTVARADMPDLYRRAMCLCCTSEYEGFPNTFLEAWSFGRPVVTSFEPDGLIQRLNLGTFGTDVPTLVKGIAELAGGSTSWAQKSHNARRYYFDNHRPETVMPRFAGELVSAWKALRHENSRN